MLYPVNRVVAFCLLILFPPTIVVAEVKSLDHSPLRGFEHSRSADALANKIAGYARLLHDRETLSPDQWEGFADAEEGFAIEHARLGNLKKLDEFIRVNLTSLKKGKSAEQQSALDTVSRVGVYVLFYEVAQKLRAQSMRASLTPHLIEASYMTIGLKCDAAIAGVEAAGVVAMLSPATAPLGVILTLSGIVLHLMEKANMAC